MEGKTFEENLKKLEGGVKILEDGDMPLKQTLEKFEECINLSKLCTTELETAKQRVEKIMKKDGEIVKESVDIAEQ